LASFNSRKKNATSAIRTMFIVHAFFELQKV
jgi:hypothetical protein